MIGRPWIYISEEASQQTLAEMLSPFSPPSRTNTNEKMYLSGLLSLTLAGFAAAACNGHNDLCDRKFSEVTLVGSHNSAFVGTGPSHNQYVSPTEQLDMGVRFLQARTQNKGGHPQMCHSSCFLLDVGPIEDFLNEIGDWLDDNPDEVLALLLTNNDGLPIAKFREAFESTGLDQHAFRPGSRLSKDQWPTLQQLINGGTRLVVFLGMWRGSWISVS